MKISYVIPVYNAASCLADTVESLMTQKHQDFEIIIVDDASSDDVQFLKEFYKLYDEIQWITLGERSGAATARNIGNEFACGDIIAVCDAGDVYLPSRGKELVKFFEANPDIDLTNTCSR